MLVFPLLKCNTEYVEECEEVPYTECDTIYDRKCETRYERVKKTAYENVCYWPENNGRRTSHAPEERDTES